MSKWVAGYRMGGGRGGGGRGKRDGGRARGEARDVWRLKKLAAAKAKERGDNAAARPRERKTARPAIFNI